uniref:Uncharacterized protein n=1 Tax=Lymantria dispar multicapsid nuclear polyhedrosis virus TaxID=10449 RepID=A0A140HQL6_NPVLD|nr:hypothetical protein [Lymantria dispar multiple nucleopolyhedrovirus]
MNSKFAFRHILAMNSKLDIMNSKLDNLLFLYQQIKVQTFKLIIRIVYTIRVKAKRNKTR